MKQGLHVGNNPDGSRIEVPFELCALERAKVLQAEVRTYVDSFAGPDEREMAIGVLLKVMRGKTVDPARVAAATAVEAFTDRGQAEGDRIAAACAACTTVDELDAVTADLEAVGVLEAGDVSALRGVTI